MERSLGKSVGSNPVAAKSLRPNWSRSSLEYQGLADSMAGLRFDIRSRDAHPDCSALDLGAVLPTSILTVSGGDVAPWLSRTRRVAV
jgi:hypothetical protein